MKGDALPVFVIVGTAAACVILVSAVLLKQSETHSPRISLQSQNTSQ
jgi:hypothetical protein